MAVAPRAIGTPPTHIAVITGIRPASVAVTPSCMFACFALALHRIPVLATIAFVGMIMIMMMATYVEFSAIRLHEFLTGEADACFALAETCFVASSLDVTSVETSGARVAIDLAHVQAANVKRMGVVVSSLQTGFAAVDRQSATLANGQTKMQDNRKNLVEAHDEGCLAAGSRLNRQKREELSI